MAKKRKEAPFPRKARKGAFDIEAAEYICACMADGTSMANIFRREEHIHPFTGTEIKTVPKDIRTHYRWIRDFPKYKEMIKQAQEDRADSYVEQLMQIADQAMNDSNVSIQAARLKIDTIKWIACKFKPRSYSDEAVRNVGRTDEALKVEFNFILGDEERTREVKQIEAKVTSSDRILEEDAEEADLLFNKEDTSEG